MSITRQQRTNTMYKRITEDLYTIQGNYGNGFEDVSSYKTRKEAKEGLKEYDLNEFQYPHKIIKQRVKIVKS
jgi:hypothetical protein